MRAIASGGMATVYLGRAIGAGGFERLVALKMMHPHIAAEPEFVAMFLDEARLAARVRHPNVVATFDLVEDPLFLVMEYIEGPSLHLLLRTCARAKRRVPIGIVLRIFLDVLAGLHAAHELTGSEGEPLHLVHRDVSPQNVIVGIDGVSRITDFGVARAETRLMSTQGNALKGKLSYMAPEQIQGEQVDRRSDVYSAGVVLWEMLTEERLFKADNDGALIAQILKGPPAGPRAVVPSVPAALDTICMRALRADPDDRFPTAAAFAEALEEAAAQTPGLAVSSPRAVEALIKEVGLRDLTAPISVRNGPASSPRSGPMSGRSPLSQRSPLSEPLPLSQRSPRSEPLSQRSPRSEPLSQRSPRSEPLSQRSPRSEPLSQRSPLSDRSPLGLQSLGPAPDLAGAEGSAPGLGAVVSEPVFRRQHLVRRSVIASACAVALAAGVGAFFAFGAREPAAREATESAPVLPSSPHLPATVADGATVHATAPAQPAGAVEALAPGGAGQVPAAGRAAHSPPPVASAHAPAPGRSVQSSALGRSAQGPAPTANRAANAVARPAPRATPPVAVKPRTGRPDTRTTGGSTASTAKPAARSPAVRTAAPKAPKAPEPKRSVPRATSRTPFKPSGL
ncbi:protein kinase domain-containing protein [Sorangium sp. So ce385]|uniref:serine/threonine-protein kinase n=1 Tax=Sorangium sp. So ce385 TaxID=3133308 RepID=UPI003F5BF86D